MALRPVFDGVVYQSLEDCKLRYRYVFFVKEVIWFGFDGSAVLSYCLSLSARSQLVGVISVVKVLIVRDIVLLLWQGGS